MNRRERRTAEQRLVEGYSLSGPAQAPPGRYARLRGERLPGVGCGRTARWTVSWTYTPTTGGAGSGAVSGTTSSDGTAFTAVVPMPEDARPASSVAYRAVVDCGGEPFTTPQLTVSVGSDNSLYALLPEIYRVRDEELDGRPLQALLGVVADHMRTVEADIEQLYANWFVETCEPWALPYLAELVGCRLLPAERPGARRAVRRQYPPYARRSVADAVPVQRALGTVRLLRTLGADVGGWASAPVEQDRLVAVVVDVRDPGPATRLPDVRDALALEEIGTAFDSTPRLLQVSDLSATPTTVAPRLCAVGIGVWRLRGYAVPPAPARRIGHRLHTMDWLGRDMPLLTGASRQDPRGTDAETTARPLGRERLRASIADFYGPGRSLCVYQRGEPVPQDQIVVADLTSEYAVDAASPRIAVDPVLGRLAGPAHGLWVSYCAGFPDDLGGGSYERGDGTPLGEAPWDELTGTVAVGAGLEETVRRVLRLRRELAAEWTDVPPARVELAPGRHALPESARLVEGDRLVVQAPIASRVEATTAGPGRQIEVRVEQRVEQRAEQRSGELPSPQPARGPTTLTLDGLLIDGRLVLHGRFEEVRLHHCTLVPRPGADRHEPSLEVHGTVGRLWIEHSLLGPVRIHAGGRTTLAVVASDSVLDAGPGEGDCLAVDGDARVSLTAERVTFLGGLRVAEARATDCIVTGLVRGPRRRHRLEGSMTYSFVLPHEDGVHRGDGCRPGPEDALAAVSPVLQSRDYGSPWYAQLAPSCPSEITRGAHDGAAMGVYHDLDEPARADSVRRRLAESVPAATASTLVWLS